MHRNNDIHPIYLQLVAAYQIEAAIAYDMARFYRELYMVDWGQNQVRAYSMWQYWTSKAANMSANARWHMGIE